MNKDITLVINISYPTSFCIDEAKLCFIIPENCLDLGLVKHTELQIQKYLLYCYLLKYNKFIFRKETCITWKSEEFKL